MARSDAWSQFELDKAKAMHALGASPAEIGAAIGRSSTAVIAMVHRKPGLPRVAHRPPGTQTMTWDADAVSRRGELVNAGRQIDEIALAFNTTTGAIQTAMSRFGVRPSSTLRACM